MDRGEVDWGRLVAEAQRQGEGVSSLLDLLAPVLRKLARQVAWRLPDDALQAAHIAIWRALPKVDLSRQRSIRSMLLKTGYHAMRDEVRRDLRQSRRLRELPAPPAEECPSEPAEKFSGLLGMYLEYVRQNGAFAGAHRHIARSLGVSIAKTTSDFHRAARRYIEQEAIRPPRKQYAGIIEEVLRASGVGGDGQAAPAAAGRD